MLQKVNTIGELIHIFDSGKYEVLVHCNAGYGLVKTNRLYKASPKNNNFLGWCKQIEEVGVDIRRVVYFTLIKSFSHDYTNPLW